MPIIYIYIYIYIYIIKFYLARASHLKYQHDLYSAVPLNLIKQILRKTAFSELLFYPRRRGRPGRLPVSSLPKIRRFLGIRIDPDFSKNPPSSPDLDRVPLSSAPSAALRRWGSERRPADERKCSVHRRFRERVVARRSSTTGASGRRPSPRTACRKRGVDEAAARVCRRIASTSAHRRRRRRRRSGRFGGEGGRRRRRCSPECRCRSPR